MSKTENIARLFKEITEEINKPQKLLIKPVNGRLMLCFDDGKPLPMQGKITLRQSADEYTTATIEFGIDGVDISFAG